MVSFSETFKPVNVNRERGSRGEEKDIIKDTVSTLSFSSNQVQPEALPESEVTEELVESSLPEDGYRLEEPEEESVDSSLPEDGYRLEEPEDVLQSSLPEDGYRLEESTNSGALVGLPTGVEKGTYSENDIVARPELFEPVRDYIEDRYGLQAVENKTNAEVVELFLDNRRGNASGNSIKAIGEVDYLMDAKEDPDRLLKAGKAYAIFEGMENITGEGVTWSEFGRAMGDYAFSVIVDPINLAGGIIGKAVGGTALRAGVKTASDLARREASKQLLAGATKEAAKKTTNKIMKQSAKTLAVEGAAEISEFAAKMASEKALTRVLSKQGIKEISTATVIDAAASSGTEFLYQRSLLETNVQSEINKSAVGLAALTSMAMGGIQAGIVAKRGFTDTALITEVVKQSTPKEISSELKKSLSEWASSTPEKGIPWLEKVKKGKILGPEDGDFFIDLILGRSAQEAKEGVKATPALKGLAQIMQEGGYFFTKENDEDTISNFIADFIKDKFDQEDINSIVKALNPKASKSKSLKKQLLSPDQFSEAFAKTINKSAREMNSVAQASKNLKIDIKDLTLSDVMSEALGHNLVPFGDKKKFSGPFISNLSEIQNKFIRSLVSHPSTTMLNLFGYTGAASLDASTDLTMALYKASAGTLKSVLRVGDKGGTELEAAKHLIFGTKDRIKFALDPDMTYAAYKSAILRSTGGLKTLDRTLAGGIDVATTVDQMVSVGGKGGVVQNKLDTIINGMQHASGVHFQDSLTKSQEYVSQMNKMLRLKFKMGWNEFYTDPDVKKYMATTDYKELELMAVMRTNENIFSKSYKGTDTIGQIAGFIEDMRGIPGLGFMVPFGKFFNNTIDFGVKNTPLLNIAAKASGKYSKEASNKSYLELNARGAVVAGLVYGMAQDEDENRRQGLGLYEEVINGEVVSQQYDYPLSLFKAASRIISYNMAGEEVPPEIIAQVGKDFGGGGLTRNLTKTGEGFAEFGAAILAGELKEAGVQGVDIVSDIVAQGISGFLRPLQPVDTALGIGLNVSQRPKDTAQGNKFVGDSFKYIDTLASFVVGESGPPKVSAATGEFDQQSSTSFGGIRAPMLTDTQRLMNLLGVNQWSINTGLSKEKRLFIPEATNELQRQLSLSLEHYASQKMNNAAFRASTRENQLDLWNEKVKQIKEEAKFNLLLSYDGPQSTLRAQYDLVNKYKVKEIEETIDSLNIQNKDFKNKTMGELTLGELMVIEDTLETNEFTDKINIPAGLYDEGDT